MARSYASKRPAGGSQIQSTHRIYVLVGKQEMLKRDYLHAIRQVLQETHGEVEAEVFDGKLTPLGTIMDAMMSFGLMQQHRLVIVDKADEFMKAHREAMERYVEHPVESATLVLRCETWNAGNIDKAISARGGFLKCDALTNEATQQWTLQRAQQTHQVKIEPAAAQRLVDRLGGDLGLIDSELGKLAALVEEGKAIDAKLVETLVGRASDEEAWMMQEPVLEMLANRATWRKQGEAARQQHSRAIMEKLQELIGLSEQPEVLVTYFLGDLIRKLRVATLLKREGAAPPQIAREMRLWGERQTLFLKALGQLSAAECHQMYRRLMLADQRSKSGLGDGLRNLECFCAVLTDD